MTLPWYDGIGCIDDSAPVPVCCADRGDCLTGAEAQGHDIHETRLVTLDPRIADVVDGEWREVHDLQAGAGHALPPGDEPIEVPQHNLFAWLFGR